MLRKIHFFFSRTLRNLTFRFSLDAIRPLTGLLLPVLPALLGIGFFSAVAAHLSAQNPATSVAVDVNANQHPINPNIYGIGGGPSIADMQALNVTLNRIGGNNESDYNWQQDAINLDFDWYFESYLQHGPPVVPGQDTDITIQNTRNAGVGAEPMVTIPMLPYIAKVAPNATPSAASLWSFSVAKYGAQEATGPYLYQEAFDPYQADAGSGVNTSGKDIVNDPTDAYVANSVAIEKGYVQHLVSKWGDSTTSTGIKYYVLDNEPSLWSSTHRDVHPTAETYDEEYNNIVNYATAIRSVDPNAKIVGPEEWIWWAMWASGKDQTGGTGAGSDYATHNKTYYYPYLLQKLNAYQQSSGIKMLDILTVHCYTDADPSTFNIATRQLWDPTYVDPNWESDLGLNGGIQELIPLMRLWVSQYYPGLEIGCTEYSWGNDNSLGGATAQADALGIFGLYGFDLATQWGTPPTPGYLAMQIYRNYDGNLSTFGDTSVAAAVANPDKLSAFAALRTSDNALTVMVVNKQTGSTPVTVSLANFSSSGTAKAYQISSATQTSITSLGNVTIANNAITATSPSQSITLYVIPSGSVLVAPTTPTGLAATVGDGTVTLTWNAGGGATSYNVYRGTTTGGESTTALATGITTTTYTDSTAANGTKYYYKVAAVNGGGTSALSNEASATPESPAPPAPTGLTATAGNASVALSWTASSGATSYKVYRGTTAGGESTTALATGIATTTYTDSTATNGTKYYYKVAAVNGGGTSALSAEVSATPQPATSTPSTPTVTVTPASTTMYSGTTFTVKATVTGSGATPTGTVTLSGGGYTSAAQTLAGGSYTFIVPSNSLNPGADTLTVAYSGDSNYAAGNGTASITVTASAFSLATSAPSPVAAGSPANSTITASTTTSYSGSVSLACTLSSSPSGAMNLPICSGISSTITLNSGTTTGTATVTVTSTAASVAMARPGANGKGGQWAGGGALLAFLIFVGIPARRRSWRLMLSALALVAALGGLTACGSGTITKSSPPNRGTTAGSYTFTVAGAGTPAVNPAPTTTFTLTIQ